MKKGSWLQSDSFLKRCFAIYGHALVAHIIVSAAFIVLWIVAVGFFAATYFHGMREARNSDRAGMMQGGQYEQNRDMMDRQPVRRQR